MCLLVFALLLADAAGAQTLVADIPVHAVTVAIDSSGTRVSYLVGFHSLGQVDVRSGHKTTLFDFHPRASMGMWSNILISPTGAWVAGAGNGTLALLEQPTGTLSRVFQSPGRDLTNLAASPSGDRIAGIGGFHGIAIWDVVSGHIVRRIDHEPRGGSYALAWSPRGEILAQGGSDWPAAEVILWDAASGKELRRMRKGLAPIHCLAFSPDGDLVVGRDRDGTLIAWKVASGKVAWSTHPADAFLGANLDFLPGGRLLVVGGDVLGGKVAVIDAANGRKRLEWIAHSPPESVLDLDCSSGRPWVVTAGRDGRVRIWDLGGIEPAGK